GRDGLSARRMAVLETLRAPSLCRHVRRELLRNAWLNFTPDIPTTACHQRNYVERYSRFNRDKLRCYGPVWSGSSAIANPSPITSSLRAKANDRCWPTRSDVMATICIPSSTATLNVIPYQRRAAHAGQCGVEVEGGRVPTSDWML